MAAPGDGLGRVNNAFTRALPAAIQRITSSACSSKP